MGYNMSVYLQNIPSHRRIAQIRLPWHQTEVWDSGGLEQPACLCSCWGNKTHVHSTAFDLVHLSKLDLGWIWSWITHLTRYVLQILIKFTWRAICKHKWFLESKSYITNPKRDWCIWRLPRYDVARNRQPPNNWKAVFQGVLMLPPTISAYSSRYLLHRIRFGLGIRWSPG